MPAGEMRPAGYFVLHHGLWLARPVYAYGRWMRRIPDVYRGFVLDEAAPDDVTVREDLTSRHPRHP
jgi:hypothetical protein